MSTVTTPPGTSFAICCKSASVSARASSTVGRSTAHPATVMAVNVMTTRAERARAGAITYPFAGHTPSLCLRIAITAWRGARLRIQVGRVGSSHLNETLRDLVCDSLHRGLRSAVHRDASLTLRWSAVFEDESLGVSHASIRPDGSGIDVTTTRESRSTASRADGEQKTGVPVESITGDVTPYTNRQFDEYLIGGTNYARWQDGKS